MAYLVDSALSFATASGTSFALTMPAHTTDDVLVAFVCVDPASQTLSMTGWNQVSTTLSGTGITTAMFFKIAASAADTGTVSIGASDAISVITMSLRDVDISTIATTATSGTGAVATITFASQASTPFPAGTTITVANVTPSGYNGTYISTGGSATTVTYASATTGAQTVAGTITAQVDNSTQAAVAAASQFSSASITTNKNDTFVLYAVGQDGTTPMILSDPGVMFLASGDSTGTTATTSAATGAAWYQQRTAGATPTPSWTTDKSGATNRYTVSFRNKTGGSIPAYIDDVISPGTSISPMHHIGAAGLNGINYSTSLPYANIGPNGTGLTTTFDAAALVGDVNISPFTSAVSTTPAAQAAGTSGGFVIAKASGSWNFSSGFFVGTVINAAPKGANFFHGSTVQGGSWLSFGDASNFYRSYQVLARDSTPNTEGRAVFSIQVGQSETRYGFSASAVDASAITTIMFLSNCPLATITMYCAEFHLARTHVIAGGDATTPVDTAGVVNIGKSFRTPVIQQSGAAGLISYVPIQVGGGDAVNFKINAGALQFPRRWSTAKKELNFHATDGAIGISYAGKAGDVITHTNSVITSPSSYYWEINSAATSAATWDFSGLVIVGAAVTLRNVMTFNAMAFSSCSSLNFTGCTVTSATISQVPAGNDTLTTNGSTIISGSEINVTGVTAGNRWCSVASPVIFANNTFIGSASSGHAIRITSTSGSPFTFVGNTFTSFGGTPGSNLVANSGSTSAAIFNDSNGAITINISGGGSTPTIRNGSGASTTVVSGAVSASVNVKNLDGDNIVGARVFVKAATGGPFPFNVTVTIANSGTIATVTHAGHAMATSDKVVISGASHDANNGIFTITKIDDDSYSYVMGSAPGSNPDGIIKSNFVVLSDLTDVDGNTTMSRVFPSDQPVTGWARKATTPPPFYKQSAIGGSVDSETGFSANAILIVDE